MASAKDSLPKLLEIEGCLGACIVDSNSGMTLAASSSHAVDLEVAAAGNTEVVRAKRKTMKALNLNDNIEDMLLTLGKAYHLIRPLASNDALFIYLVLDKTKSNLAMSRIQLRKIEQELRRCATWSTTKRR
jgi:predicted regulator of Ras-like GTPase activity (Roadblock/LC7/MglB family)